MTPDKKKKLSSKILLSVVMALILFLSIPVYLLFFICQYLNLFLIGYFRFTSLAFLSMRKNLTLIILLNFI